MSSNVLTIAAYVAQSFGRDFENCNLFKSGFNDRKFGTAIKKTQAFLEIVRVTIEKSPSLSSDMRKLHDFTAVSTLFITFSSFKFK